MSNQNDYLEMQSYLRSFDGSQPVMWYCKAGQLHQSAVCIRGRSFRKRIERAGCYYMLIGLTFENLLKGLIILRKQVKIPHKGEHPEVIKGHNLIRLASTAGFQTSPTEKDFLERLHGYVDWRGKYPTPLKDSGFRFLKIPITTESDEIIDATHRRLKRTFEDECPNIRTRKTRLKKY